MPGFKDSSINTAIENKIFNHIVAHLLNCCLEMKSDCLKTGSYLFNHEDKITNRLVVNYLNKGANIVRFEIQTPENYDARRDEFVGRTDIKVRSINWFLGNSDDYYIIECKRIDGSKELNTKYVTEGVSRFISNPPKYYSVHNKNIMLGYVVSLINIPDNTDKIDQIQSELLGGSFAVRHFVHCSKEEQYTYSYQYDLGANCIELRHLFVNLANVIQS